MPIRPWRQPRRAGSRPGGKPRASTADVLPRTRDAPCRQGHQPGVSHVLPRSTFFSPLRRIAPRALDVRSSASPVVVFHVEHARRVGRMGCAGGARLLPQQPTTTSGDAAQPPPTGRGVLSIPTDRAGVTWLGHATRSRCRPARLQRLRTPCTERGAWLGYPDNPASSDQQVGPGGGASPGGGRSVATLPRVLSPGGSAPGSSGACTPGRREAPKSRSTWNTVAPGPVAPGRPRTAAHPGQAGGPEGPEELELESGWAP
jgi:hypothetical protein